MKPCPRVRPHSHRLVVALGALVALVLSLSPQMASAADKAGEYGVKVTATLTPDYVYTKTTDAPDLNLVILIDKKVVYSAAKTDGYKTMADANWLANFHWTPGIRVGLRLVDADLLSSDTIVELSWEGSGSMPLAGTVDLSKVLGYTATGCSITFEVIGTPKPPNPAPAPNRGETGSSGPAPLDPTCYQDSPCCKAKVSVVIVATERSEADARAKAAALARTHGFVLEPEVAASTDGYDGYLPPAAHPWFDGTWPYLAVIPTNFLEGLKPDLWVVIGYSERPGTGGVDRFLGVLRSQIPDAYVREARATHCVGGFH